MSDLFIDPDIERTHSGNCLVINKDRTVEISVKFDGCTNIINYCPIYNDGAIVYNEYIHGQPSHPHFCELDLFIQDLQKVKELAIQHFGPEWPN